jgi:uncharacterized protein
MQKDHRDVNLFIILAFGLAWSAWGAALLAGMRPGDGTAFQLAILPGLFAPALAAIIVRRWVSGEGFANAGLRPNLNHWPLYLLAWFLPLIITAGVVLLAYAFNLSLPDYTLQRGFVEVTGGAAPEGITFLPLLLAVVLSAPFMAPLMLGEEFGWRGYLQPRLFPGRPLLAAGATGVAWALWHLPLHLAGYHLYGSTPAVFAIPLLIIYSILLSIVFGWLQHRTGSVWAPALAHAAVNMIGVNLTNVLFGGGPNYIWLSFGGILSWIPLSLVCMYIYLTDLKSGS